MTKEDIYILITRESKHALIDIKNFTHSSLYDEKEKLIHKDEYGKIETKRYNFRFVPYNETVKSEHWSFLRKPSDNELVPLKKEDFLKFELEWVDSISNK